MQHKTLDQLRHMAGIAIALPLRHDATMDRRARLERWMHLLRRRAGRSLHALPGTEFLPAGDRDALRHDDSPIAIAFSDPVLRAAGLRDDTYGEAKVFFGISDAQLHNIVCFCRCGERIPASVAARGVRAAIVMSTPPNLFERMIGYLTR